MSRLSIVLKKLRESKNITQMELADRADLGKGTIGDIERGVKGSKPETLEKIVKALNLNEKEREELFSCLIPEDLGLKLTKKEKLQKENFMSQATFMFNDENISDEDKQKMFDSLQEVFFRAKLLNKRKKDDK